MPHSKFYVHGSSCPVLAPYVNVHVLFCLLLGKHMLRKILWEKEGRPLLCFLLRGYILFALNKDIQLILESGKNSFYH